MKFQRKWLIYLLYVLAATVFLLYYLFPSDTVKAFLENTFNDAAGDLAVEIGHLRPSFPPGLMLYDINFYKGDDTLFQLKQLRIVPSLLSYFRPYTRFRFKGISYDGAIGGMLFISEQQAKNRLKLDADFSGIQIKDIPALDSLSVYQLSGRLDGKISFSGTSDIDAQAEVDLILHDAKVFFPQAAQYLQDLHFSSIEVALILDGERAEIKQCTFAGRQIEGAIAGVIQIKTPYEQSHINLRGNFTLHHLLLSGLAAILFPDQQIAEKGIDFTISGTFDDVRFSLN